MLGPLAVLIGQFGFAGERYVNGIGGKYEKERPFPVLADEGFAQFGLVIRPELIRSRFFDRGIGCLEAIR